MLAEECARWSNVEVTLFRGLLVDFCAANDIQVISKGYVVRILVTSSRWLR